MGRERMVSRDNAKCTSRRMNGIAYCLLDDGGEHALMRNGSLQVNPIIDSRGRTSVGISEPVRLVSRTIERTGRSNYTISISYRSATCPFMTYRDRH